jgi:hypothetical protein
MAYTLTTITTKPTAAAWYPASSAAAGTAATAYRAWIKTNPGFVASYSVGVPQTRPDSHVARKSVSVWASIGDYNAFVAARATQAYYIALQAYNLTNGIISVDSQTRG